MPKVRVAGAVLVAVALLVVVGSWLVPVEFTVAGSSVSCGTPIANVSSVKRSGAELGQSIADGCTSRNRQRIMYSLVLGVVASVAGLFMLRSADYADQGRAGAPVASLRRRGLRFVVKLAVAFAGLFALLAVFFAL